MNELTVKSDAPIEKWRAERSELMTYVYEQKLDATVSIAIKEIFDVLNQPMIKEISFLKLKEMVSDGLVVAFTSFGLNITKDKITAEVATERLILTEQISKEIYTYWTTMPIGEIAIFFNYFSTGKLGEYRHITLHILSTAMLAYWQHANRQGALRLLNEAKAQLVLSNRKLSEEEKRTVLIDNIIKRFDDFKTLVAESPELDYVPRSWFEFDFLREQKVVSLSKEKAEEIFAIAITLNLVPDEADTMVNPNISHKTLAQNRSKEMALAIFYKELINKNKHIKELI